MVWHVAPPKLSKEAQEWDKAHPLTPAKQGSRLPHKQAEPAYCVECDADMHEDLQNGNLVCYSCGITEQMLVPDAPEYVDLQHATVITRSQHKPMAYVKQLIRRFGITDYHLECSLLQLYNAVIFWSLKHKPDARKSLPN